tara:strand:+ start:828 stop:1115 length:288 start_codon:yes stop_codon:yes gene_type:complete
MAKNTKKTLLSFNPEGAGYDYKTAKKRGYLKERKMFYKDAPAKARHHLPSLDPKTGMILKGTKHPTFYKTLEAEKKRGFKIIKQGNRYFSIKGKK